MGDNRAFGVPTNRCVPLAAAAVSDDADSAEDIAAGRQARRPNSNAVIVTVALRIFLPLRASAGHLRWSAGAAVLGAIYQETEFMHDKQACCENLNSARA